MKRVINFRGYWIIKSCGYYYPEVNSDFEAKTSIKVKEYLERCYIPAMNNLQQILNWDIRN